jgi:hypothetical protein
MYEGEAPVFIPEFFYFMHFIKTLTSVLENSCLTN